MRVTRVGPDGIDVDWFLRPDGAVILRPRHLGQEVEIKRPGAFDLQRLGGRLPLERERLEQIAGQPMYRVSTTRWMPLTAPYYSGDGGQPTFQVPDLPPPVTSALVGVLERADGRRFGGWLRRG